MSSQKFWQRTLAIYTIGSQTHVLVRFFPFGCILDCFSTARNLVQKRQTGAINAKVRAMISYQNFCNERSRYPPLDPKLLFWCVSFRSCAFWTASLLHKTCCKTRQTGAINAKVCAMMSCQNLCNDRSRSTPLDPKLMFWCVSFRSGAFWTVSLLHETQCKTRQTGAINVKVHVTMSCQNFFERTLPIHTIGP